MSRLFGPTTLCAKLCDLPTTVFLNMPMPCRYPSLAFVTEYHSMSFTVLHQCSMLANVREKACTRQDCGVFQCEFRCQSADGNRKQKDMV